MEKCLFLREIKTGIECSLKIKVDEIQEKGQRSSRQEEEMSRHQQVQHLHGHATSWSKHQLHTDNLDIKLSSTQHITATC